MTESDWMQCTNPHKMLDFLAQKHARRRWFPWFRSRAERDLARKTLLFAMACCHRVEELLVDARSRQALQVARRYVDHEASTKEWRRAAVAASHAADDASSPIVSIVGWRAAAQARAEEAVAGALAEHDPANVAAALAREAVKARAQSSAARSSNRSSSPELLVVGGKAVDTSADNIAWENEARTQADMLRDIFGNPFHAVKVSSPPTNLSSALAIAKRIYQEASFAEMPQLAEALRQAGITDTAIVSHCERAEGHVHGCWVIDLLLGKSSPLMASN